MTSDLPPGTTRPRGLDQPIRWPLVPARDLFELKYGKALVSSQRRHGSVPVYGTNGQCGVHDEALFSGPGLILGRKGQGPLGVEWCDGPFWVIDTAYSLVSKREDVDLRFFYYVIKYVGLNHLKDGTSNPSLSRATFGAQALPLPSLAEQRRIARVLSALDNKIDANRRLTSTLESIARAIFKSWFVDFDPVRGKMKAVDTGLPSDLANLCASSLDDDSGVPHGWNRVRLGNLVTVRRDAVSATEMENEYVDHYSLPAFDNGRLPAVEPGTSIKSGKYAVENGTVLVSRLNPRISRVWLVVGTSARRAVCSTEFMVLAPQPPVTLEFLYGLVSSPEFKDELASRVTGTSGSHQRVRPADALDIVVTLPPASLIDEYSRLVGSAIGLVTRRLRESRGLAELRDGLLRRLLDGTLAAPLPSIDEGGAGS